LVEKWFIILSNAVQTAEYCSELINHFTTAFKTDLAKTVDFASNFPFTAARFLC
jgi:hypothetical protein